MVFFTRVGGVTGSGEFEPSKDCKGSAGSSAGGARLGEDAELAALAVVLAVTLALAGTGVAVVGFVVVVVGFAEQRLR